MAHLEPGRTPKRILVVEDEALVRMTIVDVLEDEGYAVVEAATGDEAARLMEDGNGFALVFTDLRLPGGLSGYDVVELARQHGIPVICLSGLDDRDTRERADAAGAHFLAKPFRPAKLVAEVEAVLARFPAPGRD
jgi:DNA-binding response OmpR family regulator